MTNREKYMARVRAHHRLSTLSPKEIEAIATLVWDHPVQAKLYEWYLRALLIWKSFLYHHLYRPMGKKK